jgi:hypothetical protein
MTARLEIAALCYFLSCSAFAADRYGFICTNDNPILTIAIGLDDQNRPCGLDTLGNEIYHFDCASRGTKLVPIANGREAVAHEFRQAKDLFSVYHVNLPANFRSLEHFSATYNMLVNDWPKNLSAPLQNAAAVSCVKTHKAASP